MREFADQFADPVADAARRSREDSGVDYPSFPVSGLCCEPCSPPIHSSNESKRILSARCDGTKVDGILQRERQHDEDLDEEARIDR
jgi:hypothetical protein